MLENRNGENAAKAAQQASGQPGPAAFNLLGRGLPQFGWIAVACVFLALFLPDFALTIFGPGAGLYRAEYLRIEVWAPLISAGVEALALCWLLANVRKALWLYLTIVAIAPLDSHIYAGVDSVFNWLLSKGTFTFEQSWKSVVWQLTFGLCYATIVLAAVKLPRRFGFAIPLVAAGLRCGTTCVLYSLLQVSVPLNHYIVIQTLVDGLVFGIGLWIALELQHRRAASAERPDEARFSNGVWIISFAFSSLLGISLLVAGTHASNVLQPIFIAAGFAGAVAATVILLVFLYRAWRAIQTPYSISAGAAVGRLFIPIYSFYWIFQAFPGFAPEYDNFAAHHELNLPRVPRGWLIAFAVSMLVAAAGPLVNPFLVAANLAPDAVLCLTNSLFTICGVVAVGHMSDAVNRIPLVLTKAAATATV